MVNVLSNDDIDCLLAIGERQRADLLGVATDLAQADAGDDAQQVTRPDEPAKSSQLLP